MQKQLLLLPVLLFGAACSSIPGFGSEPTETSESAMVSSKMATDPDPAPPASLQIPNFTVLTGKVAGGGFITAAQVSALPAMGYTTIINLQAPNEPGVQAEIAAAQAAGLNYISIPVSGNGFTLEDAHAVAIALEQNPGHTLLHCRSGGRATAVWALTRAISEGLEPKEAMFVAANEGCRSIPESMIHRVGAELAPR